MQRLSCDKAWTPAPVLGKEGGVADGREQVQGWEAVRRWLSGEQPCEMLVCGPG